MTSTVVRRDEGQHHAMIDGDHVVKATVHDAVGAFEVFEVRAPAQEPAPAHISPWSGVLYVLEGRLRVTCDAHEDAVGPGDVVTLPAGVPCTFAVEGDGARFLAVTSGDGAGRFFADFARSVDPARPAAESFGEILSVAARHGVRLAGA